MLAQTPAPSRRARDTTTNAGFTSKPTAGTCLLAATTVVVPVPFHGSRMSLASGMAVRRACSTKLAEYPA